MQINLNIVDDITYKHAKFIMKFFVLWATKKKQHLINFTRWPKTSARWQVTDNPTAKQKARLQESRSNSKETPRNQK
jgi:hypothetical protein